MIDWKRYIGPTDTMKKLVKKHNLSMRTLPIYHPGVHEWILIHRGN